MAGRHQALRRALQSLPAAALLLLVQFTLCSSYDAVTSCSVLNMTGISLGGAGAGAALGCSTV